MSCASAAAQTEPSAAVSSLPASQPTQPALTPTALPASDTPAAPAPHATVDFYDGKLTVEATNESLNHILGEISRKASIKITGGVADERVFGRYGPASPAAVLAELLDGTGSNLLLVDGANGSSELILTPRRGGASPPSSNASSQSSPPDQDQSEGQYVPPIRPYAPPAFTGRGPVAANPDGSPANQPNSDPGDPNANKTPQQIYDQLQRALQQRQQFSPQSAPQ
jgi:hypothetical protein